MEVLSDMPNEEAMTIKIEMPTGMDDLLQAVGKLIDKRFPVCPCCGAKYEDDGDNALGESHKPGCEMAALHLAAMKLCGVHAEPIEPEAAHAPVVP